MRNQVHALHLTFHKERRSSLEATRRAAAKTIASACESIARWVCADADGAAETQTGLRREWNGRERCARELTHSDY